MARPAASSPELTIRKPEVTSLMVWFRKLCVFWRCCCDCSEAMFVLMLNDTDSLLEFRLPEILSRCTHTGFIGSTEEFLNGHGAGQKRSRRLPVLFPRQVNLFPQHGNRPGSADA